MPNFYSKFNILLVQQVYISSEFMDRAVAITDFLVHERCDKMAFQLQLEKKSSCVLKDVEEV